MKKLQVMVCGLLIFSILGCPVMAAAAPMDGEVDPTAVEVMDPNVMVPDESIMEDAAPAIPDSSPAEDGTDQGADALPPAGDQIVDAAPAAQSDLTDVPVVAASGKTISAKDIVSEASSLVGKYKYVWGGKSPSAGGFDCTGLIYYVYHTRLGHSITFDQLYYPKKLLAAGTRINKKADLKPGDIVQYKIPHVGIYIGNNTVIHSGTTYGVSKISINADSALPFDYGIRLNNVTQGGSTSVTPEKPTPPPQKKTYTVTFNPNGGSVSTKTKKVEAGGVIGTMPTPTRSGYQFQGWCDSKEGSGMIVNATNFYVSKNITLYARWKKVETNINFSGLTAPKTHTAGNIFSIGGTITSTNSKIASVKVEVINTSTKKAAISASDNSLNTSKYSLPKSKVDNSLKFGTLKAGTYYIKYTVKTKDGTTSTKQTANFTVKAASKTTITFSGLTAPKTHTAGNIFSIGGTITSTNSKIASVKAEVINTSTKKAAISASDNSLNTIKYNLPKSKVDNSLKFGTLKAGTYYIKYTVKTKDGTTSTKQTANFTVKAKR